MSNEDIISNTIEQTLKMQKEIQKQILDEITARLVAGLQPESIFLFGSQARQEATEASDIDLLVVVPESTLPRHQRESFCYNLLWGISTPVDVIVLTKQEYMQSAGVKTSLAATVQRNGKLLYGNAEG